jgi:hypothetical protein
MKKETDVNAILAYSANKQVDPNHFLSEVNSINNGYMFLWRQTSGGGNYFYKTSDSYKDVLRSYNSMLSQNKTQIERTDSKGTRYKPHMMVCSFYKKDNVTYFSLLNEINKDNGIKL